MLTGLLFIAQIHLELSDLLVTVASPAGFGRNMSIVTYIKIDMNY
jgi:hypothetical protein